MGKKNLNQTWLQKYSGSAHDARLCLSARTQPPMATGAPSQTSATSYHTIRIRLIECADVTCMLVTFECELMNANTARLDHESIMAVLRMAGTDMQVTSGSRYSGNKVYSSAEPPLP